MMIFDHLIVMLLIALATFSASVVIARCLATRGGTVIAHCSRQRYDRQVTEQLPDALALLAGGLKAGLSLVQTCDAVALEMPLPIAKEFAILVAQTRAGRTIDAAFTDLARRISSEEVEIVAQAVAVLTTSGGNLVETFDRLAATMRERKRVAGRIRSLTAQGLAQGAILMALPIVLLVALGCLSPGYVAPLFATPAGWCALTLGFFLELIGGVMIKRIVTIRV